MPARFYILTMIRYLALKLKNMTVLRTVQISDDQLSRFEKMMEENGFKIIREDYSEIPLEVQQEIERRAVNWDDKLAIPAEEVLTRLRNRL